MQHDMITAQQLSDLKGNEQQTVPHEGTAQYMLLLFERLHTSDSVSNDAKA